MGSFHGILFIGSPSLQLWMYRSERMCWQAVSTLLEAEVETVAWANSVNRPKELIAVGSGKVARVFGLTGHANKPQVRTSIYLILFHQPYFSRRIALITFPLSSCGGYRSSLSFFKTHIWHAIFSCSPICTGNCLD